jgi:hypothetical protein
MAKLVANPEMKRLGAALGLTALGAVTTLTGLAWDAYLHARDPNLVHSESLFTLSNPGHLLLITGTAVTVLGIAAALLLLPVARVVRVTATALIAATALSSAGVLAWAAQKDSQQQAAASLAAKDQLVRGAGAPGTAEAGIVTHQHAGADPSRATAAEKAAAQLLLEQTKLGTQRFAALQAAIADGYRAVTPVDAPIVHYVNPAYLVTGDTLNPEHPESLIYGNSAKGPILLAAMYIAHRIGQAGPDIGGPLTLWHAHSNLCFSAKTNIIDAFTDAAGNCPAGSFNSGTPEMLHVWVVDNPNGPFSTDMNPQALVKLLEAGSTP